MSWRRASRTEALKDLIAVARGRKEADLLLHGGEVLNVFSGERFRTGVAVSGGRVAGFGDYSARESVDVSGKILLPGFIDSHVHLESSLLTPAEFARAVLPTGTTAVVADPHEIANVLGPAGIDYMLEAGRHLPLDLYLMLPSCVPATDLETSGSNLKAADLAPYLRRRRVLGLAEFMNYPGVLAGSDDAIEKLVAFREHLIDGHAPELAGRDLAAYIAAGISSDHESLTADEAREKVRLGMTVFVREGSSAKDLENLLPAVNAGNARFFTLCTDDLQPVDLQAGGLNLVIAKAIGLGADPLTVVRMATLNPARHFGLRRTGALFPGCQADLVVIDSFASFTAEKVFKRGKLVAESGQCLSHPPAFPPPPGGSVRTGLLDRDAVRIQARGERARVIGLVPHQIETHGLVLPVRVRNGYVEADSERDILKLLVIERHRATGNIGRGLVRGFGLKAGALASSVAHDSHNLITVGADDDDILTAAARVGELGGGMVVVRGGRVMAELALPVAGLLSVEPLELVADRFGDLERAARDLGSEAEHPFGTLSFLALPVIPELKLTDRGLVDSVSLALVDLFP